MPAAMTSAPLKFRENESNARIAEAVSCGARTAARTAMDAMDAIPKRMRRTTKLCRVAGRRRLRNETKTQSPRHVGSSALFGHFGVCASSTGLRKNAPHLKARLAVERARTGTASPRGVGCHIVNGHRMVCAIQAERQAQRRRAQNAMTTTEMQSRRSLKRLVRRLDSAHAELVEARKIAALSKHESYDEIGDAIDRVEAAFVWLHKSPNVESSATAEPKGNHGNQ